MSQNREPSNCIRSPQTPDHTWMVKYKKPSCPQTPDHRCRVKYNSSHRAVHNMLYATYGIPSKFPGTRFRKTFTEMYCHKNIMCGFQNFSHPQKLLFNSIFPLTFEVPLDAKKQKHMTHDLAGKSVHRNRFNSKGETLQRGLLELIMALYMYLKRQEQTETTLTENHVEPETKTHRSRWRAADRRGKPRDLQQSEKDGCKGSVLLALELTIKQQSKRNT